ncbi:MAG: NAD(P)/FAD-dependent oxidoreductase [Gemmatimonadota bacterium]|nr:NAD(P)/FAD-dependent oxidoreductase [Gemmatimonadota bacterium]
MIETVDYAILGAGPAGTRAARTIRAAEPESRVVVLSTDPHPFYNRILLTKTFLKSDEVDPDQVVLAPVEAYEKRGIEMRLGTRVERLDPDARTLALSDGADLAYENCLIATGARPNELPVPGGAFARTLRSLDDAITLREEARRAERAIVVGGGLIGVEVAAALVERGAAVRLLAREPWLFGHLAPEPVGCALERILADGGVEVALETTVVGIDAEDGRRIVRTESGAELEAPLVVAGVGVTYNVEFLEGSGLVEPGRGVRVNAFLESEAPGLWAAGDVAAFEDPVLKTRHHVEHWLHAQHQGRRAALNMTGEREPYARVSAYDTELFGTTVAAIGAPEIATEWSGSGGWAEGRGHAIGSTDGRTVAAFRIGEAEVSVAELVERIERDAGSA